MAKMSKRVRERLVQTIRQFVPIIKQQKDRDVSEADTVTLVKDLLSDTFGYDKYTELTGEYAIRGTYCDLAVSIDNKLLLLIEVKAIGAKLDERHIKQAVDYATNKGVEWVVLTNAIEWRLYHIIFSKPIEKKLVVQISLPELDMRKDASLEQLYAFTKEGYSKGAHVKLKDMQEATSQHIIAALIMENESVQSVIRRELRRIVDAKVEMKDIKKVLEADVIKRGCMDGDEWAEAKKLVKRQQRKAKSKKTSGKSAPVAPATEAETPHAPPPVDSGPTVQPL